MRGRVGGSEGCVGEGVQESVCVQWCRVNPPSLWV